MTTSVDTATGHTTTESPTGYALIETDSDDMVELELDQDNPERIVVALNGTIGHLNAVEAERFIAELALKVAQLS